MLPLLLYQLGREERVEVKLAILNTLPQVATHKVRPLHAFPNTPGCEAASGQTFCIG